MRYFLSALGTSEYKQAVYQLDGASWRTSFAPAAIAALGHLRGATGLILLTADAREKNWPALKRELDALEVDCKPLSIPERLLREDVFLLLDALTNEIPPWSSVFLDITLGLRHLPVVYYAALTFAAGLKKVLVDKIYYAPWELHRGDDVEVFDITLTFRLLEWFHALTSFRDSGDGRPLSQMLDSDVSQLFRLERGDPVLAKARDAIRALSADLAAGLPLQAGIAASRLNTAFTNLTQVGSPESPSRLAAQMIHGATNEIATEGIKIAAVQLSEGELARQLRVARWYALRGDLGKCFAILREWMVNARLLASGKTSNWLSHPVRAQAERFFTSMRHRSDAMPLDEPQRRAASLWETVSQHRNFLQHCGMSDQAVSATPGDAEACLDQASGLMEAALNGLRSAPNAGRLLLTPLGNSPGTIYTAVKSVTPDSLIVISSSDARRRLEEALQQAGWIGSEPLVRVVKDPFAGFNETSNLMDDEVIAAMAQTGEIIVNLTGATTAMQWVVESMARRAELLGLSVRRVALIDRRPLAEQQSSPYVAGQVIYLDQPGNPSTDK